LYRGINDFKKGYQPRSNTVKDEKGDLVTDSHGILASGENTFPSYRMYLGLIMLGRQKYIQQSQ